jgi:hypothetical protein
MEFFKNRLAHLMGILLPLAFVLAVTAAPVAPSRTPITFHAFPAATSQSPCDQPVRLPAATSYNTSTAYDAGQIYFVAAKSETPFQQIMGNLRRRDFSAVSNTALFYSGTGTGGIAEAGVEGVLKGEAAGAAADASAAKALQEQAAALERLVGHGGGLADITGSEQGAGTAGRESVVAAKAAKNEVVIGKMADITPGKLGSGERALLDRLPDQGGPRSNWRQNSSVLRQEMGKGLPIRDASVDRAGNLTNNTGFLRAERNLLQNHEWTYNPKTQLWSPPSAAR